MSQLKTLIVLKSVHHQNTEKVARAIAEVLRADIVSPEDATAAFLSEYDLVGFGSGIYFGRFHSDLRRRIKDFKSAEQARPAFLFSTSGLAFLQALWHWPLKRQLLRTGFEVIGEFSCYGHDTVGPLWLIGGLNRGHPNDSELDAAAEFARGLLLRIEENQSRTAA